MGTLAYDRPVGWIHSYGAQDRSQHILTWASVFMVGRSGSRKKIFDKVWRHRTPRAPLSMKHMVTHYNLCRSLLPLHAERQEIDFCRPVDFPFTCRELNEMLRDEDYY